MFKSARYGAVACSLLGPALLSGCAAPPHPAQASNAVSPATVAPAVPDLAPLTAKSAKKFTLNTPIKHIAADPDGKAILDRDIPGVMASKEYPLFDDMSLTQIALMSNGRLTKSKLDLVQTDLVQLSSLSP